MSGGASSTGGGSSGACPACPDLPGWTISLSGAAANNLLWAPHAVVAGSSPAVMLAERTTGNHLWAVTPAGAALSTVNTGGGGHFISGSPAFADASARSVALVHHTTKRVRLFDLADADSTHFNEYGADRDAVSPPVGFSLLSTKGLRAVVEASDAGVQLWTRNTETGWGATASAVGMSTWGTGGWVARSCSGSLVAVNSNAGAGLVNTDSTEVDNAALPITSGAPLHAPILLERSGATTTAFLRNTNQQNMIYWHNTQGVQGALVSDAPVAAPAFAFVRPLEGGTARWYAVIPTTGSVVLAPVPAAGGPTFPVTNWLVPGGSVAMGGAVAARMPDEDTDTVFLGDAMGRIHAMRDGVERAGWPVAGTGAVTRSPLLVLDPVAGNRLLLVTVHDNTTVAQQVRVTPLGAGSHRSGLTWPEYQHDADNSGCVAPLAEAVNN